MGAELDWREVGRNVSTWLFSTGQKSGKGNPIKVCTTIYLSQAGWLAVVEKIRGWGMNSDRVENRQTN